ncbi:MAG: hypothetical protein A3C43_01065 [Candidatus Schekmanbacteria bacterium RIFCSPHIGHO2_02_FULL_38_11]|uniref:DNA-binding protein n=1 Tax=Candidatus Schekmanbacteria bacterium RIFCSPLOWO2_12_FULL_38_15 TaxID=1817883 RepID=A0A1F7SG17_9BACT|nr:MAG: hypothetical protein A2043_07405 [Candidatus Schekmanbacteria bacterium GWA2_38_9]OGL49141.1 MAG: hypothetical protein A3H37_04190 [Candidatus Schekmanbacteria bacterium RIFCSPLOWO2_02_FULL_38_14]OGL51605.1 MAG: hypothetical protein A3C43_01065 [Candidatus Schekmanbacteria bacterium RIFCSPHIGHO2_02_FULL_38_11]OGL52117.1 MAG: hypothetical protein A3G31_06775 [Candidatus Schekmanbacteria bacterium RIFCSPLOWO2_12_FULL_38_15]
MKGFRKVLSVGLASFCLMAINGAFAETKKAAVATSHSQAPAKFQKNPPLLSGKVAETFNSGGYTYLLLENKVKKIWVAVPQMKATVGKEIALMPGAEMQNFTSKTLKRKFDSIIFSAGPATQQGMVNPAAAKGLMGNNGAKAPTAEKVKVAKTTGPNAYTVVEIYKNKETLNNKNVVVKGKVVKVSAGIMGKNWIHLQDGTGNAKDGSNELVVTSQDIPKVNDVVTASGTLYKDKNFGAGYKYTVIMEKASVKK